MIALLMLLTEEACSKLAFASQDSWLEALDSEQWLLLGKTPGEGQEPAPLGQFWSAWMILTSFGSLDLPFSSPFLPYVPGQSWENSSRHLCLQRRVQLMWRCGVSHRKLQGYARRNQILLKLHCSLLSQNEIWQVLVCFQTELPHS